MFLLVALLLGKTQMKALMAFDLSYTDSEDDHNA